MGLLALLACRTRPSRRGRCGAGARAALCGAGWRVGAAGRADRARRLGQHQLRGAGLHRLSAVQRPVVAARWTSAAGFTFARELGRPRPTARLPFDAALVGDPLDAPAVRRRRSLAAMALAGVAACGARGARRRRRAVSIGGAGAWLQLATGLSNVVLGWPLAAALAHTGRRGGAGGAAVALLALVGAPRAAGSAPAGMTAVRCPVSSPHERHAPPAASPPRRRRALAPVLRADQAARGAADRVLRA